MSNSFNTVFYCGSTYDLYNRVLQHKEKFFPNSFSARYNLFKLVYFESFEDRSDALNRERQIKAGSRRNKIRLIESINPEYKDLFPEFVGET